MRFANYMNSDNTKVSNISVCQRELVVYNAGTVFSSNSNLGLKKKQMTAATVGTV